MIRDFSESLPMALLRAREAAMQQFRPSLRAHEVTEQQWRVLRALGSAGEIEVGELARLTCLLGPSLSRILRELQRRKLIRRRAVPADLRRTSIAITEAGSALIRTVAPHSERAYAAIARRFGPARLAELLRLCAELEAALVPDEGVVTTRHGHRAVELKPVGVSARRVTIAEVDWLVRHRVGRKAPRTDAGKLLSRMRDDGER